MKRCRDCKWYRPFKTFVVCDWMPNFAFGLTKNINWMPSSMCIERHGYIRKWYKFWRSK